MSQRNELSQVKNNNKKNRLIIICYTESVYALYNLILIFEEI